MKKGFTLIELLATIVVLSIIGVITTTIIFGLISDLNQQSYQRQINLIEKAAENYLANNILNNSYTSEYIFLDDLINNGYLKQTPTNINGVIKVDFLTNSINFIDVNHNSGEVVLIDDSKTISNIFIEGQSIQEEQDSGKNMIPTQFEDWEDGHYSLSTGLKDPIANRIRVPYLIRVVPNQTYYFSLIHPTASFVIRSYDISGNFVMSKGVVTTGTIIANSNEYYFSISLYNATTAEMEEAFNNKTIKVIMYNNNESNKEYETFIPKTPTTNHYSEIKSMDNSILIGRSKNLFDKSKVIMGSYYSSTGTVVNSATSSRSDDFIKIDKNNKYTWNGNNQNIIINTFDINQNHIERLILYTTHEYIFNENVSFVKISSFTRDYDFEDFMFVKGNYDFSNYISFVDFKINLPNLRGFENTKDIYDLKNGIHTINIGEKVFDGTESWSISGMANVEHLVAYTFLPDVAYTSSSIEGLVTHGYVVPVTLANTINSGFIHNSNSSHWLKFPMAIVNSTSQIPVFLSQEYNKGTPVKVNYIKMTPVVSNLAPVTIPSNLDYLYLDSSVKGNIIVEYE
jgi:prepilin-type N-terminal cleavage/methylation domain-containing protein